jgi:hypothetical protein
VELACGNRNYKRGQPHYSTVPYCTLTHIIERTCPIVRIFSKKP